MIEMLLCFPTADLYSGISSMWRTKVTPQSSAGINKTNQTPLGFYKTSL